MSIAILTVPTNVSHFLAPMAHNLISLLANLHLLLLEEATTTMWSYTTSLLIPPLKHLLAIIKTSLNNESPIHHIFILSQHQHYQLIMNKRSQTLQKYPHLLLLYVHHVLGMPRQLGELSLILGHSQATLQ